MTIYYHFREFKKWVKEHFGPLEKDYNPHHGFEPYWPGGDWLFKDPELPPHETTTKVPLVCGEECNYLYTRIGKVCGRQVSNAEHHVCVTFFGLFCITPPYDEFHRGFYTFDTYCKFLDAQCRTTIGERWILVHEGECHNNLDPYFRPINNTKQPRQRLSTYFKNLSMRFKDADLPPPLRQGVAMPLDRLGPPPDLQELLQPEDLAARYPNTAAGTMALPYTVKQHIRNFMKNLMFGNSGD
ncbi:unnamed protein product [Leptosia nina]|uniref:Uncharacterized protein n=1 Tax=Leptosia nina TaxID=320188 RepID=A0AAV1JYE1_9NEOP